MLASAGWGLAACWDPRFWVGDREFSATDLELVWETTHGFRG